DAAEALERRLHGSRGGIPRQESGHLAAESEGELADEVVDRDALDLVGASTALRDLFDIRGEAELPRQEIVQLLDRPGRVVLDRVQLVREVPREVDEIGHALVDERDLEVERRRETSITH